jgi:uncharacterized protein
MSTKFIKDPHEVVKAGQVVKVKVLETDVKRQRIALTMRLDDDFAAASSAGGNAAGGSQSRGSQDRRSGQRPQQRREPEPAGALAAAFAKLKR